MSKERVVGGQIVDGSIENGTDMKRRLKEQIMEMLTKDVPSNELDLGDEKPAVIEYSF